MRRRSGLGRDSGDLLAAEKRCSRGAEAGVEAAGTGWLRAAPRACRALVRLSAHPRQPRGAGRPPASRRFSLLLSIFLKGKSPPEGDFLSLLEVSVRRVESAAPREALRGRRIWNKPLDGAPQRSAGLVPRLPALTPYTEFLLPHAEPLSQRRPRGGESAPALGCLRPGALAWLPARARVAHAAGSGHRDLGSSPRARPGGAGIGGQAWIPPPACSRPIGRKPREAKIPGRGLERGSREACQATPSRLPRPGAAPRPGARVLAAEGRTAGASGPRTPGAGFVRPPPDSGPGPARRRGSQGLAFPRAPADRPGTAGPSTCRPPRGQGERRSVDNVQTPKQYAEKAHKIKTSALMLPSYCSGIEPQVRKWSTARILPHLYYQLMILVCYFIGKIEAIRTCAHSRYQVHSPTCACAQC
ncbi:collagen alpha-1(I) chain-like [Zalophus californianus]|uniref:Collagen alpha-1(I) chain-like n=1 Tax=Zalophus californianus TaxID=9704 RepID=A0A6J2BGT1_ZALCA|nr:collagen alpha-1(I) chain-like [Zalophus californianus]